MSYKVVTIACALLLAQSACAGDPFEAIGRNADAEVDNDPGPGDATLPDARDVSSDAAPGDGTVPDARDASSDAAPGDATMPDARDVSSDAARRDVTLPDSTQEDSSDTGVLIDVTLPPDIIVVDARPDEPIEAAAPDADAGAAWCAGRWAMFCADFDTVPAVSDGWTMDSVTPGAALDFNLIDFTSPGRSLRAKLPAGSGSEMSSARLTKVVSTSLSRSVLEFDLNVASIGATPGDWLLQIARLGRNGAESAVALLAMPMGKWAVLVTTHQPVFSGDLTTPPQHGSFVRVSMDVLWSATAGSVTVAFDGVNVFAKNGVPTAVAATTSSVDLTVGLFEAIGPTPPAELSVDNVVLR